MHRRPARRRRTGGGVFLVARPSGTLVRWCPTLLRCWPTGGCRAVIWPAGRRSRSWTVLPGHRRRRPDPARWGGRADTARSRDHVGRARYRSTGGTAASRRAGRRARRRRRNGRRLLRAAPPPRPPPPSRPARPGVVLGLRPALDRRRTAPQPALPRTAPTPRGTAADRAVRRAPPLPRPRRRGPAHRLRRPRRRRHRFEAAAVDLPARRTHTPLRFCPGQRLSLRATGASIAPPVG